MEWQGRLMMLASPVAEMTPLQWVTLATALICLALATGIVLLSQRHAVLKRELAAAGGSARSGTGAPGDGVTSLEGISLSPIDRVFPRRPTQFLLMVGIVSIGAWLGGYLLAPNVQHFFASSEWGFQPFYLAAHLIALRMFINVFTRNYAAGVAHLNMSRTHALKGIRPILGPWGALAALVVALPFCTFDFLYLYSPRYARMGRDDLVRSIDFLMWGIWSLEWFINAFIWVLLVGFMIKNCTTIRRFPFRAPIHAVLADKHYRPFLQMSSKGATVVLGFSICTVIYLTYTGGELTDYLGLGITVALLFVCFVPPWLLLRAKVDEAVQLEIRGLRADAGLTAPAHVGILGGTQGGSQAGSLETRFEQTMSLLRLWHLQTLYGSLGQTEAKAIVFRLLAPAATIGWQVANNYTDIAQRLIRALAGGSAS